MKRCIAKVMSYDQFGEVYQMKLDGGRATLPSCCGLLSTLLTVVIISLYAFQKYDVLVNRKDVNVLSTVNRLFFNDTELFSYENGFNIAVAITAYDSEEEWILDRKYGELYF